MLKALAKKNSFFVCLDIYASADTILNNPYDVMPTEEKKTLTKTRI